MAWTGATVRLASTPAAFTLDTWTDFDWDTEVEDNCDCYDNATSASEFTVPNGATHVEFCGNIRSQSSSSFWLRILVNGSEAVQYRGGTQCVAGESRADFPHAPIPVEPGDVVKMQGYWELAGGGILAGSYMQVTFHA